MIYAWSGVQTFKFDFAAGLQLSHGPRLSSSPQGRKMAVHPEQLTHDRINLGRLVRRLEKAFSDDSWDDVGQQDVWTKAQDTLQVR
jgi:hypothetical protein